MLLNAAAVYNSIPKVPPLSPRFMGPPPPVSVKRKALFSPTGSRDFPHPVKFQNLVPSICLYKHRFKDEDPPYFQLKHGKGRKSNLTDRASGSKTAMNCVTFPLTHDLRAHGYRDRQHAR